MEWFESILLLVSFAAAKESKSRSTVVVLLGLIAAESVCQAKGCQEVNASVDQVKAVVYAAVSTSVKLIFSPANIFSLAASTPLDFA